MSDSFQEGRTSRLRHAARSTTTHRIELDARRVFYCSLPAGPAAENRPPLLLIHGISCCTDTWKPFVEAVARREASPALIVPDLPAHGWSEKPPEILGMADFAGWVERLLDRLEVPRVDVMGHSMGCQVALSLAHLYPERVRWIVLLGPTTGGKHVSTLRNFVGLTADSARERPAYNLRLLRVFFRMGPLRYLRTIREMQRDDALGHAREIAAPTLVLRGSGDLIIPKRVAQALAGALRDGVYGELAGAPHAAQFTHPEATADRVLAFLAVGDR